MSRSLAFACLVGLLPPARATAQDAAAWRDSVTRLTAEARALEDSLVVRDSNVVEIARRNGVILSATPSERGTGLAAFQFFTEHRARWFGSALPTAGGFRLAITTFESQSIFTRFDAARRRGGTVILTGLPDTGNAVQGQGSTIQKELGNQLVTGFAAMMFPTLGASTTRWLADPPPFYMPDRDRRSLAMYMVMTSTGKAGRGCVNGNTELCGLALGLRVAPASDLTDNYPALVRADLFLSALEIGGPEAWSRIVAAHPARAEDALLAASGLPADSLLARWRSGIMALRPETGPLRAGTPWLAVGWVGVLLLGTLGASRWR